MSPTVYANECEAFYKQLTQCISEEKLIALAQEHKLVKRKRKLSIPEKINFLFAASERQIYSYKECAQHVYTQTGQHITPQGIKKMYSAQTAKFAEDTAKAVLAVCMQHPIQRICNSHFTEIYLQDSTAFQLPKELASKFKGYGGDDTGSVAKIQFAYDCLSDKIKFMELGDVNKSDAQYACPKNILKSGLYIRDLGYWKLQALEEIHKAGAYFISRLHDQIKLYKSEEKKSEEIDIVSVIQSVLNKKNGKRLSFTVFLGKNRVAFRLIISRIPDSAVEQRKAKRVKKKGKKELSAKKKAMDQVNIFITNIPEELASDDWVEKAYTLRWLIELVFKTWKSCFHLAKLPQNMNIHRFLTCFWLKMTHIFIIQHLTAIAMQENIAILKEAKEEGLLPYQRPVKEASEEKRGRPKGVKNKTKPCYIFTRFKCVQTIQSFVTCAGGLLKFLSYRGQKRQAESKKLFDELTICARVHISAIKNNSLEVSLYELVLASKIA